MSDKTRIKQEIIDFIEEYEAWEGWKVPPIVADRVAAYNDDLIESFRDDFSFYAQQVKRLDEADQKELLDRINTHYCIEEDYII